jgi:F-type H+-transporting ATPase subunit b
VLALIASILAQAEEHGEEVSEAKDLYPEPGELIIGLIAFLILFYFTWRWLLPRFRQVLEERQAKIQGELERAEAERREAQKLQEQYRQQLAGAREEANRIIEESRGQAEQESQAILARAQDEIRAERDRAFQDLRAQIGSIAVELAERVVGQSLDEEAHRRLIDEFIDEVSSGASSNGNGAKGNGKGEA